MSTWSAALGIFGCCCKFLFYCCYVFCLSEFISPHADLPSLHFSSSSWASWVAPFILFCAGTCEKLFLEYCFDALFLVGTLTHLLTHFLFSFTLPVGLFDSFLVTRVYVKHWWRSLQLAWFREVFCEDGTADTLCAVPISDNETGWCLENYNSTNCTEIRDDAEEGTTHLLLSLYSFCGAWSLLVLFLVRSWKVVFVYTSQILLNSLFSS